MQLLQFKQMYGTEHYVTFETTVAGTRRVNCFLRTKHKFREVKFIGLIGVFTNDIIIFGSRHFVVNCSIIIMED